MPAQMDSALPPPVDELSASPKKRMELMYVEWYDLLRSDDLTLSSDLERVTLPNLQVRGGTHTDMSMCVFVCVVDGLTVQ